MEEKPIISIQNLNVTYFMGRSNEVRALQDISLEIQRGEFIIFFGPSGCGKSTLLYAIAGLETHADGELMVVGKSIAKLKKREIEQYRQHNIGMIFQAFYLINSLSVLKNVTLPQIAIGADAGVRAKRALELLERFEVQSQAHKLPNELSGGQQQRIAICRALMNDPDILFADEPVGNLDSKSAASVMQLLGQLNEEQQKTIVLVTHDPSHLHLAHRVFYMKDGRIIETRVNRPLRGPRPTPATTPAQATAEQKATTQQPTRASLSRELELLIRTYSSIAPGQIGTMLIPFKAKEIVSEALTGLSVEEIEKIETQVRHMLLTRVEPDAQELTNYLDAAEELGGIGLDQRTAERLATTIDRIVIEIKQLQQQHEKEVKAAIPTAHEDVVKLRRYLFETFDIALYSSSALKNFDLMLKARLDNTIGPADVIATLDKEAYRGGVGLDRRLARRVAKHIELLLLGRYTG